MTRYHRQIKQFVGNTTHDGEKDNQQPQSDTECHSEANRIGSSHQAEPARKLVERPAE